MGGIVEAVFGGGGGGAKVPPPQQFAPINPAKPDPALSAREDSAARLEEERSKARRRRGSAANVLAGDVAPVSGQETAAKVLLG